MLLWEQPGGTFPYSEKTLCCFISSPPHTYKWLVDTDCRGCNHLSLYKGVRSRRLHQRLTSNAISLPNIVFVPLISHQLLHLKCVPDTKRPHASFWRSKNSVCSSTMGFKCSIMLMDGESSPRVIWISKLRVGRTLKWTWALLELNSG